MKSLRAELHRRQQFFSVEGAGGGFFVLEKEVEVSAICKKLLCVLCDARTFLFRIVFLAQAEVDEVGGDYFGYFEMIGLGQAEGYFVFL